MRSTGARKIVCLITTVFLIMLTGCAPGIKDLKAVKYAPHKGGGWNISTPADQGLDPMKVARLYYYAGKQETIYSLLVIKNNKLIAEKYFNGGAVNKKYRLQSATKSITSALVGIAIDKGMLSGVDQKMLSFFPEVKKISDPRKKSITIQHLLQMRAGYPNEESHSDL